jgi:hypothetical protein
MNAVRFFLTKIFLLLFDDAFLSYLIFVLIFSYKLFVPYQFIIPFNLLLHKENV